MVTDKQLEANQENAQLGGVKTEEGKAVSRFNALTHGVLQEALTDYEQGYYSDVLQDLQNQYQPEGMVENMIIGRMAIHFIKLFRIQRAETEFVKSKLNPHIAMTTTDSLIKSLEGHEEVIQEGYTPKLKHEDIQKLLDTYSRYETTLENKLFRAIHELERTQRARKGEKLALPITADINQLGSFSETNKNL